MLTVYKIKNERVYEKLKAFTGISEIKRTANGKPYADDIFFSVTHTGDYALIAVSDREVGVDAERIKKRGFEHILKRFTPREKAGINGERGFFENWVVKEAYIKLLGGTLAHDLKRLEYYGGVLFCDGKKADCNIYCAVDGDVFFAVCAQSEIPFDFKILNGE